jgi:hypothetical protein
VLESVRDRQQTVIEAMRKFVDRLDEALPDLGEEVAARMVRSASGTLKARRGLSRRSRRRSPNWLVRTTASSLSSTVRGPRHRRGTDPTKGLSW